MEIIHAQHAADGPNPHGVSAKPLHTTEHTQVSMITLQPGEALKLHVTPVDAFFYVLEGHGVVEIGGERADVGRRLISSLWVPHHMNEGARCSALVVKTPRKRQDQDPST